ncbi:unnamed protein product, partial [Sphacelaria rigidula]
VALDQAVQAAADNGMWPSGATHLIEILGQRFDAVWPALRGDSPAQHEPIMATLIPIARPVTAKARLYSLPTR